MPLPDYFGPPLRRPFALILNSRQNKMPRGYEPWVKNTVAAAKAIADSGNTALTSLGMHPWNLTVWAITEASGTQIIVLPKYPRDNPETIVDNVLLDYKLDPEKTGFVFFPTDTPSTRPKAAWRERDKLILDMANILYPVAVRPGGNMASHLEESTVAGKSLIEDFRCDYDPAKPIHLPKFDRERLARQFNDKNWNYLTHWTRSFTEPWPDETSADYYRAVARSGDNYARSALASLVRIIGEKRIFAGDKHARRGVRFVSLTELPPSEAVELMKWQRRQMRYTFEPYGIAIEMNAARAFGVRKVIYGETRSYKHLPDAEKPYFQPIGKSDWRRESEWRHLGDITIADFDRRDLRIILARDRDREKLPPSGGIKVISLLD